MGFKWVSESRRDGILGVQCLLQGYITLMALGEIALAEHVAWNALVAAFLAEHVAWNGILWRNYPLE